MFRVCSQTIICVQTYSFWAWFARFLVHFTCAGRFPYRSWGFLAGLLDGPCVSSAVRPGISLGNRLRVACQSCMGRSAPPLEQTVYPSLCPLKLWWYSAPLPCLFSSRSFPVGYTTRSGKTSAWVFSLLERISSSMGSNLRHR